MKLTTRYYESYPTLVYWLITIHHQDDFYKNFNLTYLIQNTTKYWMQYCQTTQYSGRSCALEHQPTNSQWKKKKSHPNTLTFRPHPPIFPYNWGQTMSPQVKHKSRLNEIRKERLTNYRQQSARRSKHKLIKYPQQNHLVIIILTPAPNAKEQQMCMTTTKITMWQPIDERYGRQGIWQPQHY